MVEGKRKWEKALDKHNVTKHTAFPPSSEVTARVDRTEPNVAKMISGPE
jgi:hypothetical protein